MSDLIYRVKLARPNAHLFEVKLSIPEPDPDGQRLSLPAWIPGSYMIRDFAKNIVRLSANSGAGPLAHRKLDKSSWQLAPATGPVTVVYEVYAWDLSVRSAHFDTTHAYFNGTSLFLQVRGQEKRRCIVEIDGDGSPEVEGWQVATSMASLPCPPALMGRFQADAYADLIDHPVEIGKLARIDFDVADVTHGIAIYGRQNADLRRLAGDLTRICRQHVKLFGELPVDRYLFLVMTVGEGYGGLEHGHSTSLLCSRKELPAPGEAAVSKEYRRFLGLCSHEYFHLWNVKRIQPEVLQNPSLAEEVHTTLLWVFEGFTSYYDELALVRSGCIDAESYLELLAETVTRVMRSPGRFKQSVAESSFDAWTKFYKQDENAPNAIVSYYGKGALVALALDLTLRLETGNRCSLDDMMRVLWSDYGKPGLGVSEGTVEGIAESVSGLDLQAFFRHAVHGTEDLPLAELLARIGVELRLRPAKAPDDFGGVFKDDAEPPARPNHLGVRLKPGSAVITHVIEGGAAWNAGLSAGDELLAVDGIRTNGANLTELIKYKEPARDVVVHLFRRDELMQFPLRVQPAPEDTCELRLMDDISEPVRALRDDWLGLARD
jgi:predicted metalloprotease with PDZ domain